jgi:hypothetical protein
MLLPEPDACRCRHWKIRLLGVEILGVEGAKRRPND